MKKRDIIKDAYAELGRADYSFDLQPEDLQLGLRRLNSMINTWAGKGVRIAYNLPGGLDDEMETPDWAEDAIVCGLAMSLAPTIGKAVSAETRLRAFDGMSVLVSKSTQPTSMIIRGYAGAGRWSQNVPYENRIAVENDDYLAE